MIERAHHRAYDLASQKAANAFRRKDADAAGFHERQMGAIRELEAARKDIFDRYQVTDMEEDNGHPNEVIRGKKARFPTDITMEQLVRLSPDQLSELPYGLVFKRFRVEAGLTQVAFGERLRIEDSPSLNPGRDYIAQLEVGRTTPRMKRTKEIINAFGWDAETDWRAQLLLKKAFVHKKGKTPGKNKAE